MAEKKKPVKKSGSYMGAFGSALGSRRKAAMDAAINNMSAGKGTPTKKKAR
jgi:hypothetical protein